MYFIPNYLYVLYTLTYFSSSDSKTVLNLILRRFRKAQFPRLEIFTIFTTQKAVTQGKTKKDFI